MSTPKINDLMLPPVRTTPSQPASRMDLIRGLGEPAPATSRMELINGLGGQPRPEDRGCWTPHGAPTPLPAVGLPVPRPEDRGCWTPIPGRVPMPPVIGLPVPPHGGCWDPNPGRLPPIWMPPPFPGDLSPADRAVASQLHQILSDPETLFFSLFDPDAGEVALHRTGNGVVGPEGQPLFKVKTDLGMDAWIDPNTNQFYLQEPGYDGQMHAIGPMDLPEGAQFDPEAFYNPAEVRELGQVARRGGCGSPEWQDRDVAKQLHSSLSGRSWQVHCDPYLETHRLMRGPDGEPRGPEGQPLIPVKLDDGNQAFVDPNTNQYYLREAGDRGGVWAKGPVALPEGARFSNSYFTEQEVDALTRVARRPDNWAYAL